MSNMISPHSDRQFDRYCFRAAQVAWKSNDLYVAYRGYKTKKVKDVSPKGPLARMVLVRGRLPTHDENDELITNMTIVAFPHPVDFKAFETASKGVMGEGHAQENPRAIGTMKIGHQIGADHLILDQAQAHYKLRSKDYPLDPYLHETYKDWKFHCLKYALQFARKKKFKGMTIYKSKRRNGLVPIGQDFVKEIHQAAAKVGATVTEHKYSYFLELKPKK